MKLNTNQEFQETNILQTQAFNNTMAFYIPPCIIFYKNLIRLECTIRLRYQYCELASAATSAQEASSVAGTC